MNQKEDEERRNHAEEQLAGKVAATAMTKEPLAASNRASSTSSLRGPGALDFETVASRQRSHETNASSSRPDRGLPAAHPVIIEHKVRLLLSELTATSFELVSGELVDATNTSEQEKDGRTLIQIIGLIFEAVTNDAARSQLYARLCRTMNDRISPAVVDDSIRTAEGQAIAGGHLFRKYLLNRCQEHFKRGWMAHAKANAPAVANTTVNGQVVDGERRYDENVKRQGLGLVRFVGELFKVEMLSERIMHACIKKYLSDIDTPGEEEIESLCLLLTTVGQSLDTEQPEAISHMDIYFSRMKDISVDVNIDSRLRSMIVEVIELRSRNWERRESPITSTTTTTQEHATTEEEKAGSGRAHVRALASKGLTGDDGINDGLQVDAETWSTTKVIDVFRFGDTSVIVKLGPSSVFPSKQLEDTRVDCPASHATTSEPFADNSSTNIKIRIPQLASKSAEFSSTDHGKGSRRRRQKHPLREPSEEVQADETQHTSKLNEDGVSTGKHAAHKKVMSDVEITKQVAEGTEKFFSTRELDEAVTCFESLPADQRYKMVELVFSRALGSTDAEATLAGELFVRVMDAGILTSKDVEKGVAVPMKSLDDIAVDTPAAYALAAKMLFLPGLDKETVGRLGDSISRSVVTPRDKLLKQFEKHAL